jgi:hypothetical protein
MTLIDPTFFERHKGAVIVTALVVVLAVIALIFWAYSGGSKKEGKLIGNIGVATGENVIVGNLVVNTEKEVNNAANNSRQGEVNFNRAVNRDSNEYHGDSTNAFCERFPCDSTCAGWRKYRRPNLVCD